MITIRQEADAILDLVNEFSRFFGYQAPRIQPLKSWLPNRDRNLLHENNSGNDTHDKTSRGLGNKGT